MKFHSSSVEVLYDQKRASVQAVEDDSSVGPEKGSTLMSCQTGLPSPPSPNNQSHLMSVTPPSPWASSDGHEYKIDISTSVSRAAAAY